jgi:hypothetical protein
MPTTPSASAVKEVNTVIVISSDEESGPPLHQPERTKSAAARPLKRQRTRTDPPSVVDHTIELVVLRQQLQEKDTVS